MSYISLIQFENWKEHDVGNWLKGLDDAIHPYIPDFIEEEIDGKKLLMLTHSDLDKLGVTKLGHQELILEGVDLLMSLRYMFETENLQHLALQLGCKARSLHNEIIARNGENDPNRANVQLNRNYRQVPISVLSAICDIMNTLKILTSWLDRSPFESIYDISLLRNSIVKLGLELVTDAQRESPITEVENAIVKSCHDMTEYCDKLVLNMKETLVVQPASLETAIIRKKQDDELGMHIQSSYCGIHVIGTIKDRSPADLCSKVEKGDEVLQVNNQTVLGWQLVKLVAALKEKPKEVTMLLKKRPRHANPFGIIANRRQPGNRHHVPAVATLPKTLKKRRSREGEKPSRPTLQEYVTSSIPTGDIYITKESPEDNNDENDTDNDVFRSGSESPQFTLPVMVDAKQRRATVSGGSPTFERPILVVEDLGTVSARPKSQAINQAEREAAIAALLAADNMLQRRPSKKKTEKVKDDTPEKTINQENTKSSESASDNKDNGSVSDNKDNGSVSDNKDNGSISDNKDNGSVSDNKGNESVSDDKVNIDNATATVEIRNKVVAKQDNVDKENSDSDVTADQSLQDTNKDEEENVAKDEINMDQDDNRTQGFIVKKPTPLMTTTRRQKIVSTEVAGNAIKGELPQLMRIRRLDSQPSRDTAEDDDVFVKPQKKVGFSDDVPETEKEESFTHIIVGNVVQKIPIDKSGTYAKPPTVKMRIKTANSKTRLNRRVSCKDLGKGDCEGWLYKRRQGTLSKNWVKRWCVLKMYDFFYYKAKEDVKAEGVIHLPAFQVSPAPSLKTKKFAFKIHNPGTSFYFASERQDDMGKWMNKMGLASISYKSDHGSAVDGTSAQEKASVSSLSARNDDFSESEDEGDEVANAISGSVQSLTSISSLGSAYSPQNSPVIRRHHLAHTKASVGASTEALNAMYQSIKSSDLTIDGKDKTAQRKSRCTAIANMECPPDDVEELDKLRKLDSLQRTLKAKEQQLEEIDRLMNSSISSNEINQFVDEHQNLVASNSPQTK